MNQRECKGDVCLPLFVQQHDRKITQSSCFADCVGNNLPVTICNTNTSPWQLSKRLYQSCVCGICLAVYLVRVSRSLWKGQHQFILCFRPCIVFYNQQCIDADGSLFTSYTHHSVILCKNNLSHKTNWIVKSRNSLPQDCMMNCIQDHLMQNQICFLL